MRHLLRLAAIFNVAAALAFACPDLLAGWLLLAPAPLLYRAVSAYFVALFGACYLWMSRQPVIPRALVGYAMVGKTGAFLLFLALWLHGDIPGLLALAAVGDLVFAVLFARWLRSGRTT